MCLELKSAELRNTSSQSHGGFLSFGRFPVVSVQIRARASGSGMLWMLSRPCMVQRCMVFLCLYMQNLRYAAGTHHSLKSLGVKVKMGMSGGDSCLIFLFFPD